MEKFGLILIWLLCICIQPAQLQTKTDYTNVVTEVFTTNGYNKKILPRNGSEPVYLDLSFYFLGINEISEVNEKMVTTGYLVIQWTDSGLSWDSDNHNNLDRIFVPQNDIWKPDIFLQNGFKKFAELGGSYYYLEVYFTGSVLWMPFEVFESRCSLDTSLFPFDRQTCSITFVVWSHSVAEVEIQKSKEGIIYDEQFQENSVWQILSISHEVSKETRESKITFSFSLRRKPLYYVVNIILPVVFLGFLSGLVFVIPADTGEKTGYSVTVFLALAVFLTIISALLPVNSEKVSVLGIYLLLQVILGVVVLLVSTIQLRLNFRSASTPVTGLYLKLTKLKDRICCCCCRKTSKSNRIIDANALPDALTEKHTPPEQTTNGDSTVTWADVEIMKSQQGIVYDEQFQANSVWDILSISYDVSKETRESKITFTFHLKRKPLYYIVNILLPVVFLGFLNGLVFVIPADTGEKTGYSVTVFLSLAVFLTIISTVLPVNSEKVSILGIYLLLQVVLGVIVLIVSTIQLRLNARSDSKPVSGIALKLTRLKNKGCCRKKDTVSNRSNEVGIIDLDNEKDFTQPVKIEIDEDEYTWADVVTALDFYGFWMFICVYTILTVMMFIILTV
ncbi:hypothetical protein FSP39_014742 [Pinctada imbricata]|uniref:Uncharacterized protein n=1 Tax=Pinctada imbricata TaxID=66713 RepID=A0AA88XNL0_PINIB|nr:hypothetical protein FSP39_014742 [Pinctada imbricata]